MNESNFKKPQIENQQLQSAIEKFVDWLDAFGTLSKDPMDFYGSPLGVKIRKLYYKNKVIGLPFAVLALLQDTFFPSLVARYRAKGREAIGDAHYASAFLKLYEITANQEYLKRSEVYLEALKKSSCHGYSGYCWGYTYDWQNVETCYPAGTPFITVTPYGFWAFLSHYKLTGSRNSREIAKSIAAFVVNDFSKHKMPNGTYCTSYSPIDDRMVVNANSYRAAVLLDAWKEFGGGNFKEEARQNIDFILSYQETDGSWYYEPIGKRDRFIDNFHTCIVLRNLFDSYKILNDERILKAVQKGYSFYRSKLFHQDQTPLHFAVQKHNKLRKYEMYDYAEGIILGTLLNDEIEDALDLAKWLAYDLISRFQLKDGHFVTRVTAFNTRHKVPYHRWPQSQLFYALMELYMLLSKE